MTKTFQNMAAQGDMIIRRIDNLPSTVKQVKPSNGEYVVTHSETGHNHAIKERPTVKMYESVNDNFTAYLVVEELKALLEHNRSYKRHETIEIQPGVYEIKRQREEDVFGDIRRALD